MVQNAANNIKALKIYLIWFEITKPAVAMKEQLAAFGSFLDDYGRRLDAAKGDQSREGPFSPWSAMSPFSLLRAPPSEQLPVAMIVEDDNKMLSKVNNVIIVL